MTIFCTRCGTRNEEGASFCEHCGAPLRRPAVGAPEPSPVVNRTDGNAVPPDDAVAAGSGSPVRSKKTMLAGAALLALLLIGGAAAYFALTPPTATSTRLLEAARQGYGQTLNAQYRRELCLSNMNYGLPSLNVAENDERTQTWLNALVAAGLYRPAVPITSDGFFPRTLMQYAATPELAAWREGTRLCLAKSLEIADVVEIGTPREESVVLSGKGGDVTLRTVTAQLVMRTTDTAPWLEQADLQAAALAQIDDWEYTNARLQKRHPVTFRLRDGQWAAGYAQRDEMHKPYQASQRASKDQERIDSLDSTRGFFTGLRDTLSGMFSFGGHPLTGTWRMDADGVVRSLGLNLPGGLGLDATMTFTSDSMEVGGESIKCKFQVDGERIRVTPEGQPVSLIFVMQDKNTASLDMGPFKVQYKRVD